ncbi:MULTISPECIES: DUF2589 domain-containing protein [unclassified Burkholderia]|uniref:DUF2589 domain-containing protein n=1 Tax=unclassified Burkholderia TaxID=2613784 RepID=UPI0021AB2E9B|nr:MULTISPECIES: DUF2589 domain-containing protein [unclassified Burkholderia]
MFRLFRRSRRAGGGGHDDADARPGGGTARQEPDGPVPPAAGAVAGRSGAVAGAGPDAVAGTGDAAPAAAGVDPARHATPDAAGWPAGAASGVNDAPAAAAGASTGGLPPAAPVSPAPPTPPATPTPPTPPAPPTPPPGAPADDERPPPRGIALDEIARGMQHAAAAANQLLAHQYTAVLDQFFDLRDDGLLAPREVTVALDAEHTMPVPLVALATPRGLALDRMVVHLTVRGDFTEALPAGGISGNDDQRGRFYVTFAPRSEKKDAAPGSARQRDTEHIDIEMQFAALPPPEAIMRVIDEYTHRLVPRARPGSKENDDGEPA